MSPDFTDETMKIIYRNGKAIKVKGFRLLSKTRELTFTAELPLCGCGLEYLPSARPEADKGLCFFCRMKRDRFLDERRRAEMVRLSNPVIKHKKDLAFV